MKNMKTATAIVALIILLAAGLWWFSASRAPFAEVLYQNPAKHITLRYPKGWSVDENYVYQGFGPGRDIAGVKFTIPNTLATGTNLGSDTYLSVEEIPNQPQCTADKFLDSVSKSEAHSITDGTTTYSVTSTTGAGAGNRYEEWVYALSGTNPCVAVRYFIHYGAIENYPSGAVREFDRVALLAQFDRIRRTLTIGK